jgi:hypothetical protein
MSIYRMIPYEIEAVQLTWATWELVCELVGDFPEGMRGVYLDEYDNPTDDFPGDRSDTEMCHIGLLIPSVLTATGVMLALQDDWIVRNAQGQLYPVKPDIFARTYEFVRENA